MKTKTFKHGKKTYKTYMKPVGQGYEVGFKVGPRALFVGNFIHSKEANTWWTTMNQEITRFSKKYWVTPKASATFYTKFLSNHLYKTYYMFVDKCLSRHVRTYTTEFNKGERRYKQMRKTWTPSNKTVIKRAA